jgi:hypothetical protein
MTAPQLVTGVARAANWALAALLAAGAAGSLLILGATRLGAIACALYSLLALAVLWQHPLAYLAVATLTFLSLAAAMQRGDFAIAAGGVRSRSLFGRSQLRIPRPPT